MMQVLSTNGVIPPRLETLPQALVASDLEQVETIFTNSLSPYRHNLAYCSNIFATTAANGSGPSFFCWSPKLAEPSNPLITRWALWSR